MRKLLMPEKVDTAFDGQKTKGLNLESSAFLIDDDITSVTVSVDRALLPNISEKDICGFRLAYSTDGKTWEPGGGITFRGGVHRGRAGHIMPFSAFTGDIPKGRGRQIKVKLDMKETSYIKLDIDQLIRIK